MEITCKNCQAKLNIADEKVPKGKKASFLCPKCKNRVEIFPRQDAQAETLSAPGQEKTINQKKQSVQELTKETPDYDASDKPFDFLDEDAQTALICIENKQVEKIIHKLLKDMSYHIETVHNAQTALTRMKYHLFNIIVLDEVFGASKGMKPVINYLNELNMSIRRRIVVILMSDNLRTMDNMAVFHQSVNQIINHQDIKDMDKLLKRTIQEHEQFYTVFNESLKKAGKT